MKARLLPWQPIRESLAQEPDALCAECSLREPVHGDKCLVCSIPPRFTPPPARAWRPNDA